MLSRRDRVLASLMSRRWQLGGSILAVAIVMYAVATEEWFQAAVVGVLYLLVEVTRMVFQGQNPRYASTAAIRTPPEAIFSLRYAALVVLLTAVGFAVWRFVLTPDLPVAWDAGFALMAVAVGVFAKWLLNRG